MSVSWTNEKTFEFIDSYQSEPAIWDSNHAFHKDKHEVNEAWNRIADSMQISVSDLKKKKETLMSAFRMHFKKKQDSIRSGAGEEVYKPIWIFYDAMEAFLKEKYACRSVSTDEHWISFGEQSKQETETSDAGSETDTKGRNFEISKQRRHKIRKIANPDNDMLNALNKLNQAVLDYVKQNDEKNEEDECDLYGRLLAAKLRDFPYRQRQEIMYEIDGLVLRRLECLQNVSSPHQIFFK